MRRIFLIFALLISITCDAGERLRVLQFNVWQEGTQVENGLDKICNVIAASKAQIVCFSEVRNYKGVDWTTKVVETLAKKQYIYHNHYVGGDVGLISVYPIRSGAKADTAGVIYAWEVECPEGVVRVVSAHLDYTYYGLNLIRGYNGGSPDWNERPLDKQGNLVPLTDVATILEYNNKSKRLKAIQDFVNAAKSWPKETPVILCGDFNEGSHMDWTYVTRDVYGHNGVVIEWPCTRLLADAGFADCWRVVHPDPLKNPGFTWPAPIPGKSTSWAKRADERDRIDFVFARGIVPLNAHVIGPKQTVGKGMPADDPDPQTIKLDTLPWPSDHKALLIEF